MANEELLKKFEIEIKEYNAFKSKNIECVDLRNYENSKISLDFGGIKIYAYRSDLILDENKEKQVNFADFGTQNYVILDEAHKGDKEDSKRQNYFSVMSKDGFLFNFSATFYRYQRYRDDGF